ncbi:MAG: hypothetical protein ACLQMT_10240 [Candidatus Acidiferrales bacterium]
MKRWMLTLLTIVTIALVLVLPVAVSAAPRPHNAQPGAAAAAAAQMHPEIQDAIAALRNARDHLDHARHDFGGHRVAAIQAIDEAIHQLKICMDYDR